MQTAPLPFRQLARGHVRPLSWGLRISFDKAIDDSVVYFELDTSLLDGPDVLTPSDGNIVQEWDKYEYDDYSDRVMQMEWTREQDVPYSVNLAMADIVLNNYDGYFTRGISPLDPYLLPKRPMRILSGFGLTTLPQFVGLTETVPKVDKSSRTASVHAVDFLSFLFNKPLDQTIMLENVKTDEVLDYLFQLFGLLPAQYVLDEAFNEIKFVYFEKGKKLGEAIRELMEAELGSLYMDELGTIRFVNRVNSTTTPVQTFDETNIIDYRVSDETKIINVVEIRANAREVQTVQAVYTLAEPFEILAGETKVVFFDMEDPVTSYEPVTDYLANSAEDGSGSNLTANIDVTATSEFATAIKVTFENTGATDAWITELEITGTPAKAIGSPLYIRLTDEDSIEQFEEQVISIENDFIQDSSSANSIGLSLLNYYKDYANTIELDVKGSPEFQLGDRITVDVDNINEVFSITKITNIIEKPGRFIQRLVGRVYNIPDYFILSDDVTPMSLLNSEDVLAP